MDLTPELEILLEDNLSVGQGVLTKHKGFLGDSLGQSNDKKCF